MAVIKCPYCNKYISSTLPTCTECGKSIGDLYEKPLEDETYPEIDEISSINEINKTEDVDNEPMSFEEVETLYNPTALDEESEEHVSFNEDTMNESNSDEEQKVGGLASNNIISSLLSADNNYINKKRHLKLSARRITTLIIIGSLLAAAIIFFICDHNRAKALEQRAYDRLDGCTNLEFYEDYIVRFPEGIHIKEVKEKYKCAVKEQEEYYNNAANGTKSDLLEFIKKHPSSPYIKVCENRIDSLDWETAIANNTVASYEEYLQVHPSGLFADQAKSSKNKQQKLEVSTNEKSMLNSTINSFLSALSSSDVSRISPLLASTFNFCGQADANGENIQSFYNTNFHHDDILGVHFAVKDGVGIKKLPSNSSPDVFDYTVNVTLNATLNRTSTDSIAIQVWNMTAQLTPDRKFTSINFRKN